MQRVETVRFEMLNELRYGQHPDGRTALEPRDREPRGLGAITAAPQHRCRPHPVRRLRERRHARAAGHRCRRRPSTTCRSSRTASMRSSAATRWSTSPQEVLRRQLLPYWASLLKPGGIIDDGRAGRRGDDRGLRSAARCPFEDFREVLYGAQEYEGDTHFTGFTPDSFSELLRRSGFRRASDRRSDRRNGKCKEFEITARKAGVVRVSVVICTLNRAESLGATLDCLRHQHHDDFEVIVVNGPSTDADAGRPRAVAGPDPLLRQPRTEPVGLAQHRDPRQRGRADRLHRRRCAAGAGVADAGTAGVR